MNAVLKLLTEGEPLDEKQMAEVLGVGIDDVKAQLTELKAAGIFLGWRPVLNPDVQEENSVRAVIEVKITPERDGGFNRIANRISRFDEVESSHLMSGAYDLLVIVHGSSLQKVAAFVSEKLSTIEGVLSTATHFLLRSYKEQGYMLAHKDADSGRLDVTP